MSSRNPAFEEMLDNLLKESGQPYGTSIKAEFLGAEVPVHPNGVGFSREVKVSKWIKLEVCSDGLTACVRE